MDQALADAIEYTDGRIQVDDAPSEAPEGPTFLAPISLVVLAAIGVWVWVAPPAALQGPPELTVTPQIDETGVRMDMWVQATRAFAYEQENGRLPASAEAAGEAIEGVTYELVSPEVFRLVGQGQDFSLTWQSTQTEAELLGDAPTQVQAGVAR